MSAKLLDGVSLARSLRAGLRPRVEAFAKARGRAPGLALLSAGKDGASEQYRRAKVKASLELGLAVFEKALPSETTQPHLLAALDALARDPAVDGIIVELPLPSQLDARAILAALPCGKDAEGVTAGSFGRLLLARSPAELTAGLIAPCTALAVIELLKKTGMSIAGKDAVVLGRSNIVGKPAAHLLSLLDATVTLCHSKTPDIEARVKRADIVVAALGQPLFVQGGWIKPGAVVIDAGTNRQGGKLCGDVDTAAAHAAAFITPVPGGVGPVTTAMLLSNTLRLAEA